MFNGDNSLVFLVGSDPLLIPPSDGFVVQMLSAVYRNTNRNNELDFYYQFFNSTTSSSTIMSESEFGFAGFITDVGYRTDFNLVDPVWSGGADPPRAAKRDGGSTVRFDFFLPQGESTNAFVIRTNAIEFTTGMVSVTDGVSTATNFSFQPAAPLGIPEADGLLLTGGGLIFLVLLSWKRLPADV